MYINRKTKLAYLAHMRTGSQSTGTILETLGFEQVGDHHSYAGVENLEDYSFVTTVRNHWDVFVTWYAEMAFMRSELRWTPAPQEVTAEFMDDWMSKNRGYYPRTDRLWRFIWDDLPGPLTVLRFENLETDISKWISDNGIGPMKYMPLKGRSARPRDPYQNHYTPESRRWVQDRFAEELDRLSYSFD